MAGGEEEEGRVMGYATLAEAKLMLGIALADTSEDTLITSLLSEAQSAIDLACGGRSFEAVGGGGGNVF